MHGILAESSDRVRSSGSPRGTPAINRFSHTQIDRHFQGRRFRKKESLESRRDGRVTSRCLREQYAPLRSPLLPTGIKLTHRPLTQSDVFPYIYSDYTLVSGAPADCVRLCQARLPLGFISISAKIIKGGTPVAFRRFYTVGIKIET